MHQKDSDPTGHAGSLKLNGGKAEMKMKAALMYGPNDIRVETD